jgi:hypothetical protein
MTDVRLDYPRGIVPQITPWSCGSAAAEVVIAGRGINVPEAQLIKEIGTHPGGTDDVSWITRVLNRYLPQANYRNAYYRDDPMTKAQRDQCWNQLVHSIGKCGYGAIVNWWSPANNRPAGTKGSVPPRYPNSGMVMHYVAAMGVSETDRAVWIAEPGFSPQGFWCPWEGKGSVSSLIPPKGIGWADAKPVTPTAPLPAPPKPEPAPVLASITRSQWDEVWRSHIEWLAFTHGDDKAVGELVAAAKSGDVRATRALARLEQVNPAALTAFLAPKG